MYPSISLHPRGDMSQYLYSARLPDGNESFDEQQQEPRLTVSSPFRLQSLCQFAVSCIQSRKRHNEAAQQPSLQNYSLSTLYFRVHSTGNG